MSPLISTFAGAGIRPYGWGGSSGSANFTLISTQVLASTATTVTFSSIPQGFKHLQLRVTSRTSAAATDTISMRFNGVSTASYSYHQLYGQGTSVVSTGGASQTSLAPGDTAGSNAAASIFGALVCDILDYTNTSKNPVFRSLNGSVGGGAGNYVELYSGGYMSAAAVSSIVLSSLAAASFQIGSRFSLYGVL